MEEVKVKKLYEIIKILKIKPQIEFSCNETELKPNQIALAYPDYPSWVYEIETLFEPNKDYHKVVDKLFINNVKVKDYTMEDVRSVLTYFIRGERFSDGHMASLIHKGALLKWLEQYLKLLKKEHLNNLYLDEVARLEYMNQLLKKILKDSKELTGNIESDIVRLLELYINNRNIKPIELYKKYLYLVEVDTLTNDEEVKQCVEDLITAVMDEGECREDCLDATEINLIDKYFNGVVSKNDLVNAFKYLDLNVDIKYLEYKKYEKLKEKYRRRLCSLKKRSN